MNPSNSSPQQIVLVGGGHAHVHVLSAFGRQREPGVAFTLVTRDLMTPYSGMLPGVIAGLYRAEQAHIDLTRLCAATGARLVHAEAIGLDHAAKQVLLAGQPRVSYDVLSIDVGITPALSGIEGASEHAIAVKPIGLFLQKLEALIALVRKPDGLRRVAVIGGGAGGVELLLSLRTRLMNEMRAASLDAERLSFVLVTDDEILATHNRRVRAAFRRIFAVRRIELYEHAQARAVTGQGITLSDGRSIAADAVLLTTGAAAPVWFADTGLALDPGGFIAVGATLQTTNDPTVFAAGDCAALVESPREKAGVLAVRAGSPLAANLRRFTRGEALEPWYPQAHHLALISTGERYAVASRGWFKAEGAWLWRLKDWIDRRWMRQYQR